MAANEDKLGEDANQVEPVDQLARQAGPGEPPPEATGAGQPEAADGGGEGAPAEAEADDAGGGDGEAEAGSENGKSGEGEVAGGEGGPSSSRSAPTDQPISSLPVRQYLERTVVPVLMRAMRRVAEDRPDDPLEALANILHQHSRASKRARIETTAAEGEGAGTDL